jgi:hypothetical protein
MMPLPFTRPSHDPKPDRPMPVRNQVYLNMHEFTAWNPWGQPPGHNNSNSGYIPTNDPFVKRIDYPTKVQQLIDRGWRTVKANGTHGGSGLLAGGHRPQGPMARGNADLKGRLYQVSNRPIPCNWQHLNQIELINAFTFRGDTRPPELIRADGGFLPAYKRTDDAYKAATAERFYEFMSRREGLTLDEEDKHAFIQAVIGFINDQGKDGKLFCEYHYWMTVLEQQQMHLVAMTNDPFHKAFVSTTRDIRTARVGAMGLLASNNGATKHGNFGWIYVTRVKPGFLLKTGVAGIIKEEAEVSHLGEIPWKDIYGFRCVAPGSPVYLRKDLENSDSNAFRMILASFNY